ncbi:TrgA family protein [Litorisediminicola beolgyonensis]|uniref:TrgA family protein n=1 Tax=Litorisediminicola beolgyonensis TaxID=1173614 RepID=A0ABW3ZFH8_9RHOB
MPTAPKLVAALLMAALGYLISELIKELLPDSTDFGIFSIVNAVLGFLAGWIVVGKRVGRGWAAAVSNGLTGVVALVVWGLAVQALYEMFRLSMKHRFHGAMEALNEAFVLFIDYAGTMMVPSVIGPLLIGAIVVGFASEKAAKHWR